MSFEAQAVIDNMSRLEINTTGTSTRAKLRRSLFMPETERNSSVACTDAVDYLGQHAHASRDRGTDSQVRQRSQTFAHSHWVTIINPAHETSILHA
jgi:hypothetical protein